MISLPQALFLYLATVIVGSALTAVNLRNPVHSVLMVLIMFFHMAGLYLTLNAEFLAAVQIIVYAGAILVLYLFVVFLVNLRTEVRVNRFITYHSNGVLIALTLLVALLYSLRTFRLGVHGRWSIAAVTETTHVKALGGELFTKNLLPFEVTGLILLVAVVGGIVLAKREPAVPEAAAEKRGGKQ